MCGEAVDVGGLEFAEEPLVIGIERLDQVKKLLGIALGEGASGHGDGRYQGEEIV